MRQSFFNEKEQTKITETLKESADERHEAVSDCLILDRLAAGEDVSPAEVYDTSRCWARIPFP